MDETPLGHSGLACRFGGRDWTVARNSAWAGVSVEAAQVGRERRSSEEVDTLVHFVDRTIPRPAAQQAGLYFLELASLSMQDLSLVLSEP